MYINTADAEQLRVARFGLRVFKKVLKLFIQAAMLKNAFYNMAALFHLYWICLVDFVS